MRALDPDLSACFGYCWAAEPAGLLFACRASVRVILLGFCSRAAPAAIFARRAFCTRTRSARAAHLNLPARLSHCAPSAAPRFTRAPGRLSLIVPSAAPRFTREVLSSHCHEHILFAHPAKTERNVRGFANNKNHMINMSNPFITMP
jgi:hypothetical protein